MTIEYTSKEIIFKVPKNTKIEDLQDLANLFEFKQIARKSKAKQKELDAILNESKKGRWESIKNKIGI
jgi:phage antirepressor YoqD-like protein